MIEPTRVFGFLAVSLALAAYCQPELLENPGFEEVAGELPAGWAKAIHGQGFTLSRDAEVAHSGEASARLDGEPGASDRACFLQTTPALDAPQGVRLRFWYRGTGVSTAILRFRPAPGVEVEGDAYETLSFRNSLPQEEWTERVFEAAVPATAREAGQVRVELILYQRGVGTVWYDDVALELLAKWQPVWRERDSSTQCPWRPADGRTVLQTPPDFSWAPQMGVASYTLQLSRSAEFPPDGAETVEGLAYNCYSHSRVLEPGEWFWRVKFTQDTGDESAWSEARQFTVPDDAVEFPVPPAPELLRRIPDSHPRVIATQETLPGFRARRDGPATEWWERVKGAYENTLQAEIDREPGAEFSYGDRDGALDDDRVALGQKLRSAASRATGRLHSLAFAYLVSGDGRYAEGAIARMMEMATWDPDGITSYRNHDQVFRDITWKMAVSYDWCHDAMTPEQRRQVVEAVAARAEVLYRDFAEDARPIHAWPYDSHGWTSIGFLGIVAIALAHDHPPADEWFRFVASVYPPLLPPWGGEEGGWCQGVGYWKWSTHFALWFFDALKSATGLDLYQKAWSRNNGWYKLYMHPPFCDRHHFGDGNHGPPGASDRQAMARWAATQQNPYFQWYADALGGPDDGGYHGYFWYDDELEARPPADIPQARYFADIGWVGMHGALYDPDDIMLLFKSSPYGSFNHSHADQNHFVVYAYGEPLLIDSGYYDWYGSPHDKGWTRQTKAHNCVLIDGEGQATFNKDATGEIIAFRASPEYDYTAGDATTAYMGRLERFVRHVIFLRPDVFVIVDDLKAAEPAQFTWCLHAEREMALDATQGTVDVERGRAGLRVRFLAPNGLAMRQDDDFGVEPAGGRAREWHAYAETQDPTATERFVTLLMPHRVGDEPVEPTAELVSSDEGLAVDLKWPDARTARVVLQAEPTGALKLTAVSHQRPAAAQAAAGQLQLEGPLGSTTALQQVTTWDGRQLFWGALALAPGPYRAAIEGAGRLSLNGTPHVGDEWLWVADRPGLQAIVPAGATLKLALEPVIIEGEPLPAQIVPDDVARRPGAVFFEAETYADVSGGTARAYSHREFLSGGQGVETQIVGGVRLTWRVNVPQAGRYYLALNGATHEPDADRLIELDGEPLRGAYRLFRFAHTGGFGATPAEWRTFAVCGGDGEPMACALAAGEHELKLTLVRSRLNLDYLCFVPADR